LRLEKLMSRRGETRLICYLLLLAGIALIAIPLGMHVRFALLDVVGGATVALVSLVGLHNLRRRRKGIEP
jgi:hypothetical protein